MGRGGTRIAKVGKKNIEIPAAMNYKDYEKVYVKKELSLAEWNKQNKELQSTSNNVKINSGAINILQNELAVISDNGNRNKYTVAFELMNSKAYHDRFENLTKRNNLNEGLYREAAAILSHRSGTEYEDLEMLDSRTGQLLVKNATAAGTAKFKCGLTQAQYDFLQGLGKEFEILHNHPNSTEPSTADIIGLFKRELATGSTVIGHDGSIYRMEKLKPFDEIEGLVKRIYIESRDECMGFPDNVIEMHATEKLISYLVRRKIIEYKKVN